MSRNTNAEDAAKDEDAQFVPPPPRPAPLHQPQHPESSSSTSEQAPSPTTTVAGIKYEPPAWSSAPRFKYWFSVVKGGVEIETIDLSSKPFIIIGRQGDVCDILLEHQSISRHHAVIQHRDNGTVWIYDLGSTHGTCWNRKPITPRTHVCVRSGDTLTFGQSTRFFTLMGGPPEEFDDNLDVTASISAHKSTTSSTSAIRMKASATTSSRTISPSSTAIITGNIHQSKAKTTATTTTTQLQNDNKSKAPPVEDANQLTAQFSSDEAMMKEVISRARGFDEDFKVDHDEEKKKKEEGTQSTGTGTTKKTTADKSKNKKRKKQEKQKQQEKQQQPAKRSKRKANDEFAPTIVSDEIPDATKEEEEEENDAGSSGDDEGGDGEPEPEFDEDFNEYGGRVRVRIEEEIGEGTLNLFDEEDDFYDRTKHPSKPSTKKETVPLVFDFD